ncbi:hypothetical protein BaRGS_00023171 [Batillaria attramentaria]|uniref:Uncharacterized protein n=1 Tax=Batillaria attramentaria TaxID=370345 RepID=A0ABD0KER1_9CAEN
MTLAKKTQSPEALERIARQNSPPAPFIAVASQYYRPLYETTQPDEPPVSDRQRPSPERFSESPSDGVVPFWLSPSLSVPAGRELKISSTCPATHTLTHT